MADPLAFLETTHVRAEQAAQACILKSRQGRGEWTRHGMQIRDDLGHLMVQHTWPSEGDYIVLHDPAATLRRIAADRKIIAEHANDYGDCTVCSEEDYDGAERAVRRLVPHPCATIRALAEGWGWQENDGD